MSSMIKKGAKHMSENNDGILVENYSETEDHYYEIYKNADNQFDLFTFAYDKRKDGYFMLQEHRYLLDTLEEATAKGDALLVELEKE